MTEIIGTILAVGQKLFGLKVELSKARLERKQQVALFLADLAQTIEDASTSLRQGHYPHGKCEELFMHSQQMGAARRSDQAAGLFRATTAFVRVSP